MTTWGGSEFAHSISRCEERQTSLEDGNKTRNCNCNYVLANRRRVQSYHCWPMGEFLTWPCPGGGWRPSAQGTKQNPPPKKNHHLNKELPTRGPQTSVYTVWPCMMKNVCLIPQTVSMPAERYLRLQLGRVLLTKGTIMYVFPAVSVTEEWRYLHSSTEQLKVARNLCSLTTERGRLTSCAAVIDCPLLACSGSVP